MKTTTVREVQHNLSRILQWVQDGEVVAVTKHRRVIANIVPSAPKSARITWPDFAGRLKRIWKDAPRGEAVSRVIINEREEGH
jgi:antitoxin (DNA-binding transcriptional repressor) of toxin-antitoxin stability system